MKYIHIFSLIAFAFLFTACEKDETITGNEDLYGDLSDVKDHPQFQKVPESIRKMVGVEHLEALEDLGVQFNQGITPPSIEGEYVIANGYLKNTTVPIDLEFIQFSMEFEGYTEEEAMENFTFVNSYIKFENQNNDFLTLDTYARYQDGSLQGDGEGEGTYIMGEDGYFTIVTQERVKFIDEMYGSEESEAISINTYSGKLDGDNLVEFQTSYYMKEIIKDPYDMFIPEGTGRVIINDRMMAEAFDFDNITSNYGNPTLGVNKDLHSFLLK